MDEDFTNQQGLTDDDDPPDAPATDGPGPGMLPPDHPLTDSGLDASEIYGEGLDAAADVAPE